MHQASPGPVSRSARASGSGAAGFVPTDRRRLTHLVSEARRLARRRVLLESACLPAGQRVPSRRADPPDLARRRAQRSTRLLVAFHHALDRLWAAGGYDEALEVFRAYRAELTQRQVGSGGPLTPS